MNAKTFEIRDSMTFIPVLAVRLCPEDERDRYLFARAGYGLRPEDQEQYVGMARIDGGIGKWTSDPFEWCDGSRTLQVAHQFITDNWNTLRSGDVVDVQFILGETTSPKVSESEV
jgi:hypothetical protein